MVAQAVSAQAFFFLILAADPGSLVFPSLSSGCPRPASGEAGSPIGHLWGPQCPESSERGPVGGVGVAGARGGALT